MNGIRERAVTLLCVLVAAGCATTTPVIDTGSLHRIDCDEVVGRSSVSSDERFRVNVVNRRDEVLDMYWIDFEGAEEPKGSVAPGEIWSQVTYATHPWVARDASGRCVAAYDSLSGALIEIR